jgi:hypothetical protein
MGPGEDFWHRWVRWFGGLSSKERAEYKAKWPEPEQWIGFYSFHETGARPPWVLERDEKVKAAGRPPLPSEDKITDEYHFLWMMRHYLKKVGPAKKPPGAEWAALYVAPYGDRWTVIVRKDGARYAQREHS